MQVNARLLSHVPTHNHIKYSTVFWAFFKIISHAQSREAGVIVAKVQDNRLLSSPSAVLTPIDHSVKMEGKVFT